MNLLSSQLHNFKLMKQAKAKSFIKLIGKIHQIGKQSSRNTKWNYERFDKLRKLTHQKQQCSVTVNFIDEKDKTEGNACQKSLNETNPVGIYFTQQSIKHRYDDKKNLYDIYRDSLQKKKNNQNALINQLSKNGRFKKTDDQFQNAHEIAFPINHASKLKERRQSFTYKKILRKKSVVLSNKSISIFPEKSERTMKKVKTQQSEHLDEQIRKRSEDEYMRDKKLNYKPVFRIKKMILQNCKTEGASTHHQARNLDKYPSAKKCINLNTEAIDNDISFFSFREKIKQKKQKCKVMCSVKEKFSAWEFDKIEENEQLTQILI